MLGNKHTFQVHGCQLYLNGVKFLINDYIKRKNSTFFRICQNLFGYFSELVSPILRCLSFDYSSRYRHYSRCIRVRNPVFHYQFDLHHKLILFQIVFFSKLFYRLKHVYSNFTFHGKVLKRFFRKLIIEIS